MPSTQQLLNSHVDHLRIRHGTNPSSGSYMGSSQPKDSSDFRGHEKVNGKHQELLGLQRNTAQGQPPVYPILWYVNHRLTILISADMTTGVYLTDLTFIEDGIPGVIKKTNLINFAKRSKTAEVIRDIQQYQNVPYPLQPVPELQEYILTNMQTAGDVHEMYDRSLAVEPREREDEKIAR